MNGSRPDVSVVVVSYNTCDVTTRCLDSLLEMTTSINLEIIVVDNNSRDQSVFSIKKRFPQIKIIENSVNIGFAPAQNQGLAISSGRYALVLNSDMVFQEDSIGRLVRELDTGDPSIAAVGPAIKNVDGTLVASGRRAMLSWPMMVIGVLNRHWKLKQLLLDDEWLRRHFGKILGPLHDNYRSCTEARDVEYIDGMFFLVRREVLLKSGLFDAQYFFDFEIIDLCIRIREAGYRIQYLPITQVVHVGHVSRVGVSRIIIETHRSELIFYAKFAPIRIPLLKLSTYLAVGVRWAFNFIFPSKNVDPAVLKEILNVVWRFSASSVGSQEQIGRLVAPVK